LRTGARYHQRRADQGRQKQDKGGDGHLHGKNLLAPNIWLGLVGIANARRSWLKFGE
jgi:hypothetical protein